MLTNLEPEAIGIAQFRFFFFFLDMSLVHGDFIATLVVMKILGIFIMLYKLATYHRSKR
jgi:hypothetical protein